MTMMSGSINPLPTTYEDEDKDEDKFEEMSTVHTTTKTSLKTAASVGPNQWSNHNPMPPLKTAASVNTLGSSVFGSSTFGSSAFGSSTSIDALSISDRSSGSSHMRSLNFGLPPPPGTDADSPAGTRRKLSRGGTSKNRSMEFSTKILRQADSIRINQNIESLTINKLNYDLEVVGRSKEIAEMKACLRRLVLLSQSTGFSAMSFSDFSDTMLESEELYSEEMKVNNTTFKELIWLRGYSGCGKSTLVDHLEKTVTSNHPKGLMVHGKFDIKGSDQPYSGILEAFGQIFQRISDMTGGKGSTRVSMRASMIKRRSDDKAQRKTNGFTKKDLQNMRREIADGLKMELGDELQLLVKLVPYLDNVVKREAKTSKPVSLKGLMSTGARILEEEEEDDNNDRNDGYGAGQERIKFAFRILMRVVSSYFRPLVVCLDDLQWSDVGSLEVLDYLISDKHNPNPLMIIGLYRSNEVDDTHIVTHAKKALIKKMDQCQFHVTNIDVDNFPAYEVNRVIMKMLGIDDPKITEGLAHICHRRTLGNPYFVVEFMTMLKDEGLLEFNLGLLKWVWDEKAIESATVSTDNVVQLLQTRMLKLQPDELLTLQYAACLGNSFDRAALDLIWANHSGISLKDLAPEGVDLLGQLLDALARNKYIEQLDDTCYRWVHDEVQEAAVKLLGSSKPKFQFEIGCILYNKLEEDELDDSLFAVVDLINAMEIKRRPDFATLNLRAAQKAKDISAFASAAMYVSHGTMCLPSDKWKSLRRLTMRLYTLGAEMELAIGNVDVMKEYYHEVMSQPDTTMMEKLPLYIDKLHRLSSIELQYEESIGFNLEILRQFGCELIWKWNPQTIKAQAVQKVVQTRKMLKQMSPGFHETKPDMEDPKRKAIMILLSKLLYSCYVSHERWIGVLCATKMVRMTIKYGVHDASGSSFVAFSMLLRDVYHSGNEASSLAETGIRLQNRVENYYTAAMTQYISQSFVFAWRKPLSTCLVPYMEGFISGMRSGNIEFGLWCLVSHHIVIAYQLGKPLSLILARFPNCLHQMEDMKQQLQAYFVKVQWQMMINLQGEDGESTVLKGEIFDMESLPPKTAMQESFTYFAQLVLYIYYGEYEAAADLAIEKGYLFESSSIGDSYSQTEAFHRCLALYAAARKTKQRKFKKLGNKVRSAVEKWSQDGCPNVDHFLGLLNAEQAALDNNPKKAEELYKSAIIKAARPGLSHDAALFSERYADFLRQPIKYCAGLEDEARYRYQESIRYYTEWGAMKKATMLQQILSKMQSQ